MDSLTEICARIAEPDRAAADEAQRALDHKTKPLYSLGRLEELTCQIASLRRTPTPTLGERAIVVMAADHGVADEGVSAYPQEVTGQMLANFARGGAAINVLARRAGARLVVVDMGVKRATDAPPEAGVRVLSIAAGTRNFARVPAMTAEQAQLALERGAALAEELADDGVGLIALGEMGIANTTAASAITAVLCACTPGEVTGAGTGIGLGARMKKAEIIAGALERLKPDPRDGIDVVSKVGGFEIAGLAGLTLGAAARGLPVLLDGFITGAAALVAATLEPRVVPYLIASHRSREPGHAYVLEKLRLRPLLELDLCLGEGTGAALALPLLDAALACLHEMATFESAGVSK